MTPDPWCPATVHGDRNRHYSAGCRCTAARAARARHHKRYLQDINTGHPRTIDATGSRRRVQALMAAGWTAAAIADRLFVCREHIRKFTIRQRITVRWAEAVKDLYDEIGLDEGPSNHCRSRALKAGWPPPIEWGPDIDDPAAKPLNLDRVFVEGDPRRAVPMEDVEMIALSNETWASASARLGTNRAALERRLYRAKRKDLVDRFYRNSEFYNTPLGDRRWTA